jgi:uncharacterized membrane protein YqjE
MDRKEFYEHWRKDPAKAWRRQAAESDHPAIKTMFEVLAVGEEEGRADRIRENEFEKVRAAQELTNLANNGPSLGEKLAWITLDARRAVSRFTSKTSTWILELIPRYSVIWLILFGALTALNVFGFLPLLLTFTLTSLTLLILATVYRKHDTRKYESYSRAAFVLWMVLATTTSTWKTVASRHDPHAENETNYLIRGGQIVWAHTFTGKYWRVMPARRVFRDRFNRWENYLTEYTSEFSVESHTIDDLQVLRVHNVRLSYFIDPIPNLALPITLGSGGVKEEVAKVRDLLEGVIKNISSQSEQPTTVAEYRAAILGISSPIFQIRIQELKVEEVGLEILLGDKRYRAIPLPMD